MNRIINAVAGDGKNASPARRYAAYAVIVTFIALVAALVILGVSSIVFALTDAPDEIPDEADGTGEGNAPSFSSTIEYTGVTADELDDMIGGLVDIQSNRTPISNSDDKYYYAMSGDKLRSETQKAVDALLVAYYNASNKTVVFVGGSQQTDNPSGTVVEIRKDASSFSEAEPITNDKTYGWIFSNAQKYGFIYEDNSFTYVGVAAAKYLNGKGTLDTLVTKLEANNGKNVSVSATAVGASKATSYQIYYLSADAELQVPANYAYTVLADGTNGYVITVDTSKKVAASSSTDTAAG